MAVPDYLRDPDEITRRSFATVEAEAGLSRLPPALRPIATRLVHACGMVDIVGDLRATPDAVAAGVEALGAGAPILVDCRMVDVGVTRRYLPPGVTVHHELAAPDLAALARSRGTTRSAAAVDRWLSRLAGAVVAIGNAPTALFRLLELLDAGAAKPALILAFPVGFVGAAESKQAVLDAGSGVPFITLLGRRGGSAMAAAAVNALALATCQGSVIGSGSAP